MSTRPGGSIGPYVISRELGLGGMGDARPGVDDRLARFQREVRVPASPNKP